MTDARQTCDGLHDTPLRLIDERVLAVLRATMQSQQNIRQADPQKDAG